MPSTSRATTRLFTFLLATLVHGHVLAQPDPDLSARLESVIDMFADEGLFQGVALVALNGEVVLEVARGDASFAWNVPNRVDTRFAIASVSKVFTATAVMMLVEEGRLDLDAPIGSIVPGLREDIRDVVTPAQLMTHSSGLRRDVFFDTAESRQFHSPEDQIEQLNSSGLVAEPGEPSGYSNAGYFLLSRVVEGVSGVPFRDFVRTRVLEPTGMFDTGWLDVDRPTPRLAEGSVLVVGERAYPEFSDPSNGLGSGAMYSTARDLYRFDRALAEGRILSDATRRLQIERTAGQQGLGWLVRHVGTADDGSPTALVHHNGDGGGSAAHFSRYEPDGLCIVLLSNQDVLPRTPIFVRLTDAINEQPIAPVRPAIAARIYRTAIDEGAQAAVDVWNAAMDAGGAPDAPVLITTIQQGTHLARLNRVDDARRVFELSAAAYPEAWLPPTAQGDLEFRLGNLARARELYERALALDPGNPTVLDYLDDLATAEERRGTREDCDLSPREVVERFVDSFYRQKRVREAFETWVAEDYVQHKPALPDGREPVVQFLEGLLTRFPERIFTVHRVIASGDLVAVHYHSQANPDDLGFAVVDIFRVEGCRMVEHWDVVQPVPAESANDNSMF